MKKVFPFLFVILSCGSSQQEMVDDKVANYVTPISFKLGGQTWKEYSGEDFQISFPSNWSFDNTGINGTALFISSELDAISDLFAESVNLIIQDLSGQSTNMYKYIELTKNELSQLNATNIKIDQKQSSTIGSEASLSYEFKYDIYNLKIKQRVIIYNDKAYIVTYTATVSDYNKYFSIGNKILNSFNLGPNTAISPNNTDIYENLKHKLSIKNLHDFEDINEGGNFLLQMGNFTDLNNRSYSIKYNDDWSFKVLTTEEYAKNVTREQLKNVSKILYKDISINAFQKAFPKSISEDVIHVIYSGNDIETNDRMTVAIFQYIKNSKLYTLNCQCKSTYWQYYYNDCLDLLNSLKIE
mgnify:CR=1 FL=1|tara:strand:+ start:1327 stop:2391 length:1065 start_codon:yes stop_codon:yes gene_type:complete